MKILLKELISSYFVIHYHKLTILQAHQYGISMVYLAYRGYLKSWKIKYPGFHSKFEDRYKSISFQPLTEASYEKSWKRWIYVACWDLFFLFLLTVYPLPISSFILLTMDKLVKNWRSTEENSYLWTFNVLEIIKANICNSAHIESTLINSEEWSLNLAFARNTSLGLNSYYNQHGKTQLLHRLVLVLQISTFRITCYINCKSRIFC